VGQACGPHPQERREVAGQEGAAAVGAIAGADATDSPNDPGALGGYNLNHFLKVIHSYWPGLLRCYDSADLPRTITVDFLDRISFMDDGGSNETASFQGLREIASMQSVSSIKPSKATSGFASEIKRFDGVVLIAAPPRQEDSRPHVTLIPEVVS
jgi:hypothetical protein